MLQVMKIRRVQSIWIIVALLGAGATVSAALTWQYAHRLPRRFAVVDEGRLYRSGSVTPAHLARLQKDYGIRRVVCLLNPAAPETQQEQQGAARLGLEWSNVPLRGNGSSTPEDRRALLALLLNHESTPTLVHCAAGTYRTGLAVGLYRIRGQGWPLERVMNEAREFGYEDGPDHENLRQALLEESTAQKPLATTAPTPQP